MKARHPKGYKLVREVIRCKDCAFSRPFNAETDFVVHGTLKVTTTCILTRTAVNKTATCNSAKRGET